MDHIDQELEFLNYYGVCKAEKDILHTILRGGESKEYSKGLFCFDTPFSVERKDDSEPVDVGHVEGISTALSLTDSVGDISVASQSTSNADIVEVSVQSSQNANGTVLPLPPAIPHAIVSQTGPPHHMPPFYPGQPHMTVSVSTAPPSLGPNSGSNQPSGAGNPMLMFSHPIPQMMQSPAYYHPSAAYYGPPQGSSGQPHLSFVPVSENPESNYMSHSQGQGHHKVHHDSHHPVPHSPNTSSGQGGNVYGKNRRNKPPQQQQPHYYYHSYYGQVPYYNQQQLHNVTGSPIIMAGATNMYALPPQHHPGMYNQGPPVGNEMDRLPPGAFPPQMMQMQNEMSYAQQHHPPPLSHSQIIYPHNSPTHSSPRTTSQINYNQNQQPSNRVTVTGALPQSDANALAEQNTSVRSDDKGKSNQNQNQRLNDSQIPAGTVQEPETLPGPTSTIPPSAPFSKENCTASKVEAKSHNNPVPEKILQVQPHPQHAPVVNGDGSSPTNIKVSVSAGRTNQNQQQSSSSTDLVSGEGDSFVAVNVKSEKPVEKSAAYKCGISEPVNGDTVNEMDVMSSEVRDNASADPTSDSTIDQEANTNSKSADINIKNVSVNSSSSSASSSHSVNVLEIVKDDVKTNESEENTNSVNNVKQPVSSSAPQAKGRSWASIASVKSAGNDGAATRPIINHSHLEEHPYNNVSGGKSTCQNNVPMSDEKFLAHDFTFDPAFDAARLSDENDPVAIRLGDHLLKYTLDHQSIPLAPRGLCNQSNYCFLNATLQALLACPTFVNMFRAMTPILGRSPCKATPIIQHVFDFVLEFSPLLRSQSTKKDRMREGFCVGANLEPTGIRKCLALLSKDTFKVEGRQEDAEELLSHLLNGLHDEMIKVIKWAENKKEREEKGPEQAPPVAVNGDQEDLKEEDDDQWQVMGAKNKSCLTRRTAITKSPISEAFLGQMCLSLSRVNSMKKADLEPFFTLQLAIQNDSIKSVRDALEAVSIKEEVSGITSSSGNEIEAWRQVSLEELPPVLILHLKRFVYEKNGILKINKKLDFGVDLEIGKDLLSNNSKSKLTIKQRQYKLFAVVYHDGEEAHKGHYVADCFHTSSGTMWGQWGWLRYDDTAVKPVNEANMLNPQPPRVPYLLYYRRQDTIQQQQNKKERS